MVCGTGLRALVCKAHCAARCTNHKRAARRCRVHDGARCACAWDEASARGWKEGLLHQPPDEPITLHGAIHPPARSTRNPITAACRHQAALAELAPDAMRRRARVPSVQRRRVARGCGPRTPSSVALQFAWSASEFCTTCARKQPPYLQKRRRRMLHKRRRPRSHADTMQDTPGRCLDAIKKELAGAHLVRASTLSTWCAHRAPVLWGDLGSSLVGLGRSAHHQADAIEDA